MSVWQTIPDLDGRLMKLAAEGDSSSAIARTLNREFGVSLSRDAVIGRLWRKKVKRSRRPQTDPESREERRQQNLLRQRIRQSAREQKEEARRQALAAAAREAEERASLRRRAKDPWRITETALPLSSRLSGQCAWPVGEAERPVLQLCCGAPRADGSSYCPAHRAIGTSSVVSVKDLARSLRRFL